MKNLADESDHLARANSGARMEIDRLNTELDKRKHFLECKMVLIENQPTLKNPKMKAISSTIYDYFLIRGIIDKMP